MARIFAKGAETSYKVGDKVSYSAFAPSIVKEEVTWEQAQEFKVSSMREALRKVWNIGEGELPPALKKAIDAKKKDKEEKDEDHDGDDEDEKREKTLTGKKRAAVDVNPDLVASRSH